MTVAIANTWTGGWAPPAGYTYVQSATNPVQLSVANNPGDWMLSVMAWQQPQAGAGVSACMSDDVHDWWEPVGAPNADSAASGLVRCSVWAAPTARAASSVQACPTAPYTSLAVAAYDVQGIGNGWSQQAIIGSVSNNSATSVTVPGGSVANQSLVITVFGSAQWGATVTPPAGWTVLTGSTIEGLGLASQSITVSAAYQVITGTVPAATWSVTGSAVALAGITVVIPLAAAVPSQPSPDWPAVITEAAIGSGPGSVPAAMAWTSLSPRALAMQVQQGRQYTLSSLEAGRGTITLDNPDGALIPPGSGSFSGIDSGTPLRRRCYWPGGAWQLQFGGNGSTGLPQAQTGHIFPVTAGTTATSSAWLGMSAPWAAGVLWSIHFYNSGGTLVGSANSPVSTSVVPALLTATGTVPATAVLAAVIAQAQGTPPASTTFTAAAAEPQAGWLQPSPSVAWGAANGATVTTLAPWSPDPRGAPNPTPWYVPFSGFFRRWPYNVPPDTLRGQTVAEIADAWAYATGVLNSMAREEMLLDAPYAMWPLDDAAGSPAGSNLAPGNSNGLNVVTAKLGAGGATQQWGQNSGALLGDSSAKVTASGQSGGGQGMYQLTLAGTSLNTNGFGYALVCQDAGLPSIASGVTVETWFDCNANSNTTGNGFLNVGNTITVTGSSFANGTPVTFTSAGPALPTGMTAGTIYYVISASGANFQISATPGGSAVTLSSNSSGFCATTTPWNPHVLVLRTLQGHNVAEVDIRNTDGALLLVTTAAATGAVTTTVVDTSRDYRLASGLVHVSLALTATTWRVILDGGAIGTFSGTMTAIRTTWGEACFGGAIDRSVQGYCMPGYLALCAVYPLVLSSLRVEAHFYSAAHGLQGDHAETRIDRILSYAGLAGRRWIGQQGQPYETDTLASGQDIGGQAAATAASNIATSTVPAVLSVAPCGDTVYLAKQYAWNQPVRWTLGDATALGEIPFSLAQFGTDYDPTRIYDDVQLTQLDTSAVTVPSGVMASTTVAAVEAAAVAQYGSQPYQNTAYLINDYTSAYNAGSGLLDLATWIAMIYSRPRNRVPGVVVNAAAHPSAWPLWGQAAVGDMVAVNVRLPTASTSPVISVIARVTQTNRSMKWSTDSPPVATIALALDAAPEYQALICDDPVRGLLNSSNVLAW